MVNLYRFRLGISGTWHGIRAFLGLVDILPYAFGYIRS